MKQTCRTQLLGAVVILLAGDTVATEALACSRVCPAFSTVTSDAESIVVGTTLELNQHELDEVRRILEYAFRVDEVLKGDYFEPGDVFRYEAQFARRTSCDAPPLPQPGGTALLYLLHPPDSQPQMITRCGVFEIPSAKLKREIAVTLSPEDYLDSEDQGDVALILRFIAFHHVVSSRPHPMSRTESRSKSIIDRETAIEFLVRLVERAEENSIYPVGQLAQFEPDLARKYASKLLFSDRCDTVRAVVMPPTWTDPHRSTDPCEAALEQLIRLGDARVLPVLLERLAKLRKLDSSSLNESQRRNHQKLISYSIHRLGILGDRRAVPALLRELGTDENLTAFRALATIGDSRAVPALIREFDMNFQVSAMRALAEIGDPRVVPALIDALDKDTTSQTGNVLAAIDDPRVVPALLSRLWEDDWAGRGLERITDSRIAPVVRKFRYDQKRAPAILAAQGEAEDRAFMHRLIRQGRKEGAIWAAQAEDHSAKPLLREALADGYCLASIEICYALGWLRTFDVILPLMEGRFQSIVNPRAQYLRFIQGTLGDPYHMPEPFQLADYLLDIEQRIRDLADCEAWTDWQLDLVMQLVYESRATLAESQYSSNNSWRPPDALPDMPELFYRDELIAFLHDDGERCRAVLRSGSDLDKWRILDAARQMDVNVLDHDLVLEFLLREHETLKHYAVRAVRNASVTLTVADIKQWALDGNHFSTLSAIRHMAKHPQTEYLPIIVEVFNRGWHLFDQVLHDAILANNVTELIDPLSDLLCEQHRALRIRSSSTLSQLGYSGDLWPDCLPNSN